MSLKTARLSWATPSQAGDVRGAWPKALASTQSSDSGSCHRLARNQEQGVLSPGGRPPPRRDQGDPGIARRRSPFLSAHSPIEKFIELELCLRGVQGKIPLPSVCGNIPVTVIPPPAHRTQQQDPRVVGVDREPALVLACAPARRMGQLETVRGNHLLITAVRDPAPGR